LSPALSSTAPRKPAHSQALEIAAFDQAVDDQLLELQRHRRQCRGQQREADQQELLAAGDAPDGAIELPHRTCSLMGV
jgi:hypothetical protein